MINDCTIKGFQNKNGIPFLIKEIDYKCEDYKEKDTTFKILYFKISIEPEKCHYLKIELLKFLYLTDIFEFLFELECLNLCH